MVFTFLPPFDIYGKIWYNKYVALKKGGIIIEYEPKSLLLKKGLVIIPMAILGLAIFSNTAYASNSETATKEKRIQEIKIENIQEIDTQKLIRKKQEEVVTKFTRNANTTSRGNVDRQVEKQYAKIEDITISKNMNLTKRTGISKEDFKKVIKNLKPDTSGFFYDNAEYIYDLCEKYEINEIFFCGLISAESGWNIASNHRRTHNYISLMANGKLISYATTEEGLEVAARKLHTNYLTPGGRFYRGKTLEGVHTYFCPSGSWVNLVYGRMQQVMTAVEKTK